MHGQNQIKVMNVSGYTSSHTVTAAGIIHRFLPLFEEIKNS